MAKVSKCAVCEKNFRQPRGYEPLDCDNCHCAMGYCCATSCEHCRGTYCTNCSDGERCKKCMSKFKPNVRRVRHSCAFCGKRVEIGIACDYCGTVVCSMRCMDQHTDSSHSGGPMMGSFETNPSCCCNPSSGYRCNPCKIIIIKKKDKHRKNISTPRGTRKDLNFARFFANCQKLRGADQQMIQNIGAYVIQGNEDVRLAVILAELQWDPKGQLFDGIVAIGQSAIEAKQQLRDWIPLEAQELGVDVGKVIEHLYVYPETYYMSTGELIYEFMHRGVIVHDSPAFSKLDLHVPLDSPLKGHPGGDDQMR